MHAFDFGAFCAGIASAQSGYADNGKFVHCAVVVPFIASGNGQYKLLFEKRAKGIRQPGDICFPGGTVEGTDFDSVAAGLREMREELGIEPEKIDVLGRLGMVFSFSGVMVEPVVCLLDASCLDSVVPSPDEVEEWFCLPVDVFAAQNPEQYRVEVRISPYHFDGSGRRHDLLPAQKLGLCREYHEPWYGARPRVWVYHTKHGPVWGITAEIIRNMLEISGLEP